MRHKVKSNYRGRKLDKVFCITRMDYYEMIAHKYVKIDDSLIEDSAVQRATLRDKFIEDCITADMIVREHLYYP